VIGVHRVVPVPTTVVMVVVNMVICIPREMDVRSAGVPRHVELRRVHVRHRNSAEEQLHDHEDGRQQPHHEPGP
jgi:hypothetical protein